MKIEDFEVEKEAWVVKHGVKDVKLTRLVLMSKCKRGYEVFIDGFNYCSCCGALVHEDCKAVMLGVQKLEVLLKDAVSVDELKKMRFNTRISAALAKLEEESWWECGE